MPLSAAPVSRIRKHTRSVRFEGYARAGGLWDIEAHLTDVKPGDYALAPGLRPAGSPVHDMWIRLSIDRRINAVSAEASTAAMRSIAVATRCACTIRAGSARRRPALIDAD